MALAENIVNACTGAYDALSGLRGDLLFHRLKGDELIRRLGSLNRFLQASKPSMTKHLTELLGLFVEAYATLSKCLRNDKVSRVISYSPVLHEILAINASMCIGLGSNDFVDSIPREYRGELKVLLRRLDDIFTLRLDEIGYDDVPEMAMAVRLDDIGGVGKMIMTLVVQKTFTVADVADFLEQPECTIRLPNALEEVDRPSNGLQEVALLLQQLGYERIFPFGMSPPDALRCPLSGALLLDPVALGTGVLYHRSAIEFWLTGSTICPATGLQLNPSSKPTPAPMVKSGAVTWVCEIGVPKLLQEMEMVPEGARSGFTREAIEKLMKDLGAEDLASVAETLVILVQLFIHVAEGGGPSHPFLGAPGRERLLGFLQSPHAVVQVMAANLFTWEETQHFREGAYGKKLAELLVSLLDSESVQVQETALRALECGLEVVSEVFTVSPGVVAKVVELAQSNSQGVQDGAVALLASLPAYAELGKVPGVYQALIGVFLDHPSVFAKISALTAFGSLPGSIVGDLASVPRFLETLVKLPPSEILLQHIETEPWWNKLVETPGALTELARFVADRTAAQAVVTAIGRHFGIQNPPELIKLLELLNSRGSMTREQTRRDVARILFKMIPRVDSQEEKRR